MTVSFGLYHSGVTLSHYVSVEKGPKGGDVFALK